MKTQEEGGFDYLREGYDTAAQSPSVGNRPLLVDENGTFRTTHQHEE